jgi:hypothetical protein
VRLEELGHLKNPMTASRTQLMTFQFVTWCLNQLLYHMPLSKKVFCAEPTEPNPYCSLPLLIYNIIITFPLAHALVGETSEEIV